MTPATANDGGYAKVLTFRDLIAYGLAYLSPIGPWGTFAFVYTLASGNAVLAYVIGLSCMYFTAHSYKEMVTAVPGSGSVYAYARETLGVFAGFMAGWMILLDYLLVPALMYVLTAIALGTLIPAVPHWIWILVFAGISLGVNWVGIVATVRVNMAFLLFQLVIVAGYIGWAIHAKGSAAATFPIEALANGQATAAGLFSATTICLLTFLGFDAITTLSEEVRSDQRHLVGKSIVTALMAIGAVALIQVWMMSGLAASFDFVKLDTGPYDMTAATLAPEAGIAMAWLGAFIVGASITPPMITAVSRVLHAMAVGGQLPSFLAHLSGTAHVPRRAMLLASGISVAVALLFVNHPDSLTSVVTLGAIVAYGTVHVCVIVLLAGKRKSGRWFAHVVMPLLGIVVIAAVVSQFKPVALMLGGAWIAIGAIYYGLLYHFRRTAAVAAVDIA